MKSIRVSLHLALWMISGLLVVGGCDSNEGKSPVTGIVTLDGNPYPNAQVRFVSDGGRPSFGVTDTEGVYKLVYFQEVMGADPGDYKVDITTIVTSTSDTGGGKEPPEKIPAKYNVKSELTAKVVKGENKINFDLKSKP